MKRSFSYLLAALIVAFTLHYIAPMSAQYPAPTDLPVSAEQQPVGEPSSEQPAEQPAATEEQPAEQPAATEEQPAEQPAATEEQPAEQPAATEEQPAEQPAATEEQPAEQPAATEEQPAEQPAATEEQPAEQPAATEEQPAEQPAAPDFQVPASPFSVDSDVPEEAKPFTAATDSQSADSKPTETDRKADSEEPQQPKNWKDNGWVILGTFFGVIILSFALAQFLSGYWRMPDHAFRFFALLVCLIGSAAATYLGWHKMTLGIDLRGGVVLIYDVSAPNLEGGKEGVAGDQPVKDETMDALISAVARRINPGGVKEISIQKMGSRHKQLKVIIPEAEDTEVARIEQVISESGALTFRILASRLFDRDSAVIELADKEPGRQVRNAEGTLLAEWTPVDEEERRDFDTNTTIVKRERRGRLEVLALYNDDCDVTGEYLIPGGIGQTIHKNEPAVSFAFNQAGANKFGRLTGANLPQAGQSGIQRQLGIIMNDSLYSAPRIDSRITDRGVITFGLRDTPAERQKLIRDIQDLINVLNSGSLPAKLGEKPVSRQLTGATLGEDTISKGQFAMICAALSVGAFMIVYYHGLGLIACFCVLMNLMMIMAVMLAVRAAFTLPGLAGLVLTVGMAVDANILIFERLREEFATGSSMKMAIRNAFGRATSAIVDSNLTSIITGVILYAVGSEQVKGFAVTLVLGVGFCMYTAIYCSRTVMDVIEKNRWVSRFTMLRLMTRTSIDFIGAGKIAVLVSCLLILVGAAGVVARGKGIFGIDFGGGVGIEAVFKTSQSIDTVRSTLNSLELDDLGVSNLSLLPESAEKESRETGIKVAPNTHFMITTSTPHQDEIDAETYLRIVTGKIKEAFKDSLVYNKLDYTFLEKAADSNEGTTNADAASTTVVNPQALDVSLVICPSMTEAALRSAIDGRWQRLVDEQKLSGDFRYTLKSVKEGVLASNGASILWTFSTTTASREQVETVLGLMKSEMDASPYFPSSSTVGGSVAADTRNSAILAVLGSLVCIVIYMWFRFQHIVYGIAATVTLVHNILIVLGFVALSAYVTNYLGFLQVNEFKIDLTMIAALLTLIGYSLNDTIILFDRIRENRGKSPLLTGKMINAAINQTLSRTVLTSMTTLFTCAVLYFWGGDGIHSFAFALMTGVVVGTYGSIYIASTLLLWLIEMRQRAVVRSK